MKKIPQILALILASTAFLTGCGAEKEKETVTLSVWTSKDTMELVSEQLENFREEHADEADFVFTVSMESEDTCGTMVLSNPEIAADIFTYADDQLDMMLEENTLLEITEHTDDIINASGGASGGTTGPPVSLSR